MSIHRYTFLRHIVQILIISALFITTAILFRPVQLEINRRMEELKAGIVQTIEDSTGREISYGSISPSFLQVIEIRDLVIYGNDEEQDVLLRIQELNIYYNIFKLLFAEPIEALTEISFRNTQIDLDTQDDEDVIKFLRGMIESPNTEATQAPSIKVSGRNLSLSLQTEAGRLFAEAIFFTVTSSEEALQFRLSTNIDFRLASPISSLTRASSDVSIRASLGSNFEWGEIEAAFDSFNTNLFELSDQTFNIALQEDEISIRKIQDRRPIDLNIRITEDLSKAMLSFQSEDFKPVGILHFKEELSGLNLWLESTISGSGTAEVSLATESSAAANSDIFTIKRYSADMRAILPLTQLFDTDLLEENPTIAASFDGNQQRVNINTLQMDSRFGKVDFSGTYDFSQLFPKGTLILSDFSLVNMRPLSANFTLSPSRRGLKISSEHIPYYNVGVYNLQAGLIPLDSTLSLTLDCAFDPENSQVLRTEASLDWGEDSRLDLDLITENVPPIKAYQISRNLFPELGLPDPDFLPLNLRISNNMQLSTDFVSLNVSSSDSRLWEEGNKNRAMSFSFSNSNRILLLNINSLRYDDYQASGDFLAELGERGAVSFSSDFIIEEIDYSLGGTFQPSEGLRVRGNYGLEIDAAFAEQNKVYFRANGGPIPIPLRDIPSDISFDLSGNISSPEEWTLDLERLELNKIPLQEKVSGDLLLSGSADPGAIRLRKIYYTDSFSELNGLGEINYQFEEELRLSGQLSAESIEGSESYSLQFNYTEDKLSAGIDFNMSPIRRFGFSPLSGYISGVADINGPLEKAELGLNFSLSEAQFNEDPIELSASINIGEKLIELINMDLLYLENRVTSASGTYMLESGEIDLEAEYTGLFGEESVELDVDIEAIIDAKLKREELAQLPEKDFNASLVLDGMPFEADLGTIWSFAIAKEGPDLDFSGGPQNSIVGTVSESGDFTLSLADPLPVAFDAEGKLEDSMIQADISRMSFEIEAFAAYLNLGFIRFLSGDTSGNLRVSGPINDPDFYGTISIDQATAALEILPDTLGPQDISLVFQEKTLTLTRELIPVGEGSGYVEGIFILDHWVPIDFQLIIDAESKQKPIAVRYNFGGAFVDGETFGSLRIQGIGGSVRVQGKLVAESTDITIQEIPDIPVEGEPVQISVELEITSGRGVQFYWPSKELPILRGFAETGEDIQIYYSSDTGDFSLTGKVGLQGGELFYINRSFYLREGEIVFNETAQSFDPRLSVRAEIREVADGETVKIFLVANNSKLSEFSPRFESDPQMTQVEIASILGGNIFAESAEDSINLSSAILLGSDLISQFGIIRSFESSVRESLNLDLFSIRTQLFQNVLREFIEDSSYPLDNDVPSLGKYLDNTTFFLGKFIGDDLFLELLVQLQAQNPFIQDIRSFGGLQVDTEIGLEWKTPFFLLNWDFSPEHPEDLFLTDNVFTFSWEYSF